MIDWIEEETGFKLCTWQRRILELEFPKRIPRKLKKFRKKNKIW
jgi:hypothetical protein